MFGISGEKLLILGLLAAIVLGPERLPYYAQQLAKLVKSVKRFADGAKDQLSAEVGEELDWKKLDPRQYDPRRIIREALIEDESAMHSVSTTASVSLGAGLNQAKKLETLKAGESAPFDSEAT
ncbi:MAG: Sec-independent protein translocase TatB [Actinomycetales bacterium]|nr:Sec-independent protein translocase TatB [Actinomycetales bacterium]